MTQTAQTHANVKKNHLDNWFHIQFSTGPGFQTDVLLRKSKYTKEHFSVLIQCVLRIRLSHLPNKLVTKMLCSHWNPRWSWSKRLETNDQVPPGWHKKLTLLVGSKPWKSRPCYSKTSTPGTWWPSTFFHACFNGMMNQIFTMEKWLFIVPGTHDFPLPCYILLQKVIFEEFVRDYWCCRNLGLD